MFYSSNGYNDKGENVSFVAFSPEDLLKKMIQENIQKVRVFTSELGEMPITIQSFTRDEVKEWIESGVMPHGKI